MEEKRVIQMFLDVGMIRSLTQQERDRKTGAELSPRLKIQWLFLVVDIIRSLGMNPNDLQKGYFYDGVLIKQNSKNKISRLHQTIIDQTGFTFRHGVLVDQIDDIGDGTRRRIRQQKQVEILLAIDLLKLAWFDSDATDVIIVTNDADLSPAIEELSSRNTPNGHHLPHLRIHLVGKGKWYTEPDMQPGGALASRTYISKERLFDLPGTKKMWEDPALREWDK